MITFSKKYFYSSVTVFIFWLLVPFLAIAQNSDDLEYLISLEVEELMEVQLPSKRQENLWEAPGIITVIPAEDIRRYGGNNLEDILNRLPNFALFSTSIFPDSVHSLRGQSPALDQHTLLLLNGRPMRESWIGAFNQAIYRNIPLEAIDKIEVVRGPGSVLYGTNAFSGAINIITKAGKKSKGNSVTAGYGSFDSRIASGSAGVSGEDADLRVAAKSFHTDGWRFRANDEVGAFRSMERAQESYGFLVEGSYKNLAFTGFSGSLEENIMGFPPIWAPVQEKFDMNRHFADVQYQHEFSDNWRTSFNFTYNGLSGFSEGLGRTFNDFLLEPTVYGKILPNLNLVAGMTYQDLGGRLTTENVTFNANWFNYYLQADYKPFDFLKLIAGFQVNKPENVSYDVSPRFGLIANATDNLGIKLLYGKAFRSAFASEQVTAGRSIGNPALQPESIKTFDAQVFYQAQKYFVALTYYNSAQSNTIVLTPIPRGVAWVNGGNTDFQGVELEGRIELLEGLQFQGSASYQDNDNETGGHSFNLVGDVMVKAGLSYASSRGYTLSLFNSYFSAAGTITGAQQVNPTTDSYNWLTFKGSINLPRFLKKPDWPNLTLSLYGENLADADVDYPEAGRQRINTIPHRSGVGVYGYVTLGF